MSYIQILILAILQGACELLPVSSSAHVIMAEKLMGVDPSAPAMTLLLVMLHTGTMFAVIVYFWRSWKESFFASWRAFLRFAVPAAFATLLTGTVGLMLKELIEKVFLKGVPNAEVELLFGNLGLISIALAAVGIFIILAGWGEHGPGDEMTAGQNIPVPPYPSVSASGSSLAASVSSIPGSPRPFLTPSVSSVQASHGWPISASGPPVPVRAAILIGAVQGLCLPFRGFSRSGATISTGLFLGLSKRKVEEFSFALVVILTPPVIWKEVHRLLAHQASSLHAIQGSGAHAGQSLLQLFVPGLVGMAASFFAGLLALKWLSSWLERGRWKYFGYYCLAASVFAFVLHRWV